MIMKGIIMCRKLFLLCLISLFAIVTLAQKAQEEKKDITAYLVKIVRDVNVKPPQATWEKAVILSQLKSGYEIKTDKKSLAVILFADQSKLILREKSIATIKGEVQGKQILSRNVHMDKGSMIFNVKKGEKEQFQFSSPISVASIRGTLGEKIGDGKIDSLTIVDGFADFTNLISGKTGVVTAGQTAIADSNGNLVIFDADKNKLNDIVYGQNVGSEEGDKTDTTKSEGIGPHFGQLKSKQSGSVTANLTSFEGKATGAVLYCRKTKEESFEAISLEIIGQTAKGSIPGDKVKYPRLEYYLVIKLSDGSSIMIPENGDKEPAIVPVEPIQHVLRIPGQDASMQKKVIVLKWNE